MFHLSFMRGIRIRWNFSISNYILTLKIEFKIDYRGQIRPRRDANMLASLRGRIWAEYRILTSIFKVKI